MATEEATDVYIVMGQTTGERAPGVPSLPCPFRVAAVTAFPTLKLFINLNVCCRCVNTNFDLQRACGVQI